MADIVYMAKAKWTALLDAIRSKAGKTDTLTVDTAKTAVEGITGGGGDYDISADFCNSTATTLKVQEGATQLRSNILNIDYAVKSLILPNTIKTIQVYAIRNAYALQAITFPQSVTDIQQNAIYINAGSQIENITILSNSCDISPDAFYIMYDASKHRNVLFDFSNAGQVYVASGAPITISNCTYSILVPYSLYAEWKTATNWTKYAPYIKATDHELATITINDASNINIYLKKTLQLSILYNENDNCPSEQKGVTYSIVSGPATVTQDGTVTVTDVASDGDEIVVKATSTYNSSISTQYTINIVNVAADVKIEDTTQWIDSGTTENGYKVYKSDSGSYNVDNGKSTVTLTFTGYTTVVIYVKQSSDYWVDFVEVGPIDGAAVRFGRLNLYSARGFDNKYQKVTITLPDRGTHTVQVIYSKDARGNTNDDRGYFYIAEGECS